MFPSNVELILRANGMSLTTLRRNIAVLLDCGLVIRRDSPNGKRYARKGQGGSIEQAYGFDLTPLLARADEFRQLAEIVETERKALRVIKERLTICRRDVVKLIDAGISEAVPGNWRRFRQRYDTTIAKLPRKPSRELLEAIVNDLEDLWADVHETLESFVISQNMNPNESQNGTHIQDSNPNLHSNDESEYGLGNEAEAGLSVAETDNLRTLPKRDLPLGMVLNACPEIATYALGGPIRTWRDFVAAAEEVRPHMGVSPSAWQEAVEVMGKQDAAITLAAILQRTEHIRSRGGYLRSLVEKAQDDKFSAWPMIMALLNARMSTMETTAARKTGGGADDGARSTSGGANPASIEISSALEKSLRGKGWQ
ncbi:plasmid replication protein RepC [Aminobacter aganoensis]